MPEDKSVRTISTPDRPLLVSDRGAGIESGRDRRQQSHRTRDRRWIVWLQSEEQAARRVRGGDREGRSDD